MLAGFAVLPTASAQAVSASSHRDQLRSRLASATAGGTALPAPTMCVDTNSKTALCPTITGVTVGSAWIRSSKTTPITFPVTVVVDDPSDIAVDVDAVMGRGIDALQQTPPIVVVGWGSTTTPPVINGNTKTFTLIVSSTYTPSFPVGAGPAYGGFQINPAVWGADPTVPGDTNGQFLAQTWRSGTIKALSAITNTPSATAVHKGQSFTERGKLTRFDGTPQIGQKVTIFMVPAGQTRGSYAGTATTAWNGTWSLPVRSWFTGSWFVSYPGSVFSTSVYKGVWVRVS